MVGQTVEQKKLISTQTYTLVWRRPDSLYNSSYDPQIRLLAMHRPSLRGYLEEDIIGNKHRLFNKYNYLGVVLICYEVEEIIILPPLLIIFCSRK